MTEERLPKEAAVQVAMTMGTSVGGEAGQIGRLFSSIDRAREGVAELAGSSAAAAVQLYESTARVQAMTGQVQCSEQHCSLCSPLLAEGSGSKEVPVLKHCQSTGRSRCASCIRVQLSCRI